MSEAAVLLPVQLETKFQPPDDDNAHWRLWLRVVPQPPSVVADTDHITDHELGAASRFRRALGRSGALDPSWFGTPEHRAAFGVLAGVVGPARATWLAVHTVGHRSGGRLGAVPRKKADERPSQVRGLPPRFQVALWREEAGAEALTPIGVLPEDQDARISAELPLPQMDRIEGVLEHWLTDFTKAREVGLGGVFVLPLDTGPGDLGGIAVWGLGDTQTATVFGAHIDAGDLAEAPLGTATNTVAGAPTAVSTTDRSGQPSEGAPDEDGWWHALLRRVGVEAPTGLDDLLSTAVTGAGVPSIARSAARAPVLAEVAADEQILAEFVAPDEHEAVRAGRLAFPAETGLSPLLMRALWPVLWGSFLREQWDTIPDIRAFTDWTFTHVNPEGPLPAIRLRDQPYALLPVTPLDGGPGPGEPDGLRDTVRTARALLRQAAQGGGTVRGADAQRYADLLAHGGSSRVFGATTSIRRQVVETWMPPATAELMRQEREAQLSALGWGEAVGDPLLDAFGGPGAIGLPLVQATASTLWGSDEFFLRVPLPALLDIVSEASRTLRPPAAVVSLATTFGRNLYFTGDPGDGQGETERPLAVLPDALLPRLLFQSALLAARWRIDGDSPMDPGAPTEDWRAAALQLAQWIDPGEAGPLEWLDLRTWLRADNGAGYPPLYNYVPAVPPPTVPADRLARLERAFGATLDAFSSRLDPWEMAFAWQRLRAVADNGQAERPLGAYGWVFGPFDGTPGPTESGLLHTPSTSQTLVTTLARDEYLHHSGAASVNERGETPWSIALTGAATRTAYDLIAGLRDGHHIRDVLGREVERIYCTPAASPYAAAADLRAQYPLYPERPDPRQVCNGEAALAGLLHGGPLSDRVGAAVREQLAELQSGVDALGDLSLMDGALAASVREPARAAAAMDASAGSANFPEPAFPRTLATGRELRTTVLAAIPWAPQENGATAAALAEPSVARYLETRLGLDWEWQVERAGTPVALVRLSDLGLRPIDTLALSSAQLRGLVATAAGVIGAATEGPDDPTAAEPGGLFRAGLTEGENRTWAIRKGTTVLGRRTLSDLALPPEDAVALTPAKLRATVLASFRSANPGSPRGLELEIVPSASSRVWTVRDRLDGVRGVFDAEALGLAADEALAPLDELGPQIRAAAGAPDARVVDPPELSLARRLCAALGTPATERDIDDSIRTAPAAYGDLRDRYRAVHADLRATVTELRAAARASRGAQGEALRHALRWGATPTSTPADRAGFEAAVTGATPIPGATSPRVLVKQLADLLAARREQATAPSALPSVRTHDAGATTTSSASGLGVTGVAEQLSALASPQGNLPILPRWSAERLRETVRNADAASAAPQIALTAQDAPSLQDEWLAVVAPVRPALARLEALQLQSAVEGDPALTVWATGADPWRRDQIAALLDTPSARKGTGFAVTPYVAVFGPDGALEDDAVAVGVIDSYTEWLPLRARDTHAAFGFNAPRARAPQAILLAVSPNPGEELTDESVGTILSELRASMIARGASAEQRRVLGAVLPAVLTPAEEPVGIVDPAVYFAMHL